MMITLTRARRMVTALAAAALLAGCAGTATSTDPAGPLPSTPVTGSAESPSADRSPVTPAGVVDPLAEFEARLRDATAREGALVRALATASPGSAADLRLVVGQMRSWVGGERAWLTAHPAATCYALAATRFDVALGAMMASADTFAAMASGWPGPSGRSDDPGGTAAAQALQNVARALNDAAILAKVARPDCR